MGRASTRKWEKRNRPGVTWPPEAGEPGRERVFLDTPHAQRMHRGQPIPTNGDREKRRRVRQAARKGITDA
jgi:hypothetical protein